VLCTDNAAMIACAGYYRFRNGLDSESDPFSLDAHPNLPF
jgi:N6-L-threonylcarbamoyladenine synthase